MDRNERTRMQAAQSNQTLQLQQARLQLARALESGQAAVLDRFSTKVKKNDLVIWRPPFDLMFQVDEIRLPLQSLQPGAVELILTVRVPIMFGVNNPSPALYICGHLDESGQHGDLGEMDRRAPDRRAPEPVGDLPPENGAGAGPVLVDASGAPLRPVLDDPPSDDDGENNGGGGGGAVN